MIGFFCGAFACAGAVCGVSCTSSGDCAGDRVCVEGTCVASNGGELSGGGDWQVTGSGGCSAAGGPSLAALALLALVLVPLRTPRTRRRGRGPGALVAILLVTLPASALAQGSTSFDVERFQPFGGAYDLLGVPSARVPGHLEAGGAVYDLDGSDHGLASSATIASTRTLKRPLLEVLQAALGRGAAER